MPPSALTEIIAPPLSLELLESPGIGERATRLSGLEQKGNQRRKSLAIVGMTTDQALQLGDRLAPAALAIQSHRVHVAVTRILRRATRGRFEQVERLGHSLLAHPQKPERVQQRGMAR